MLQKKQTPRQIHCCSYDQRKSGFMKLEKCLKLSYFFVAFFRNAKYYRRKMIVKRLHNNRFVKCTHKICIFRRDGREKEMLLSAKFLFQFFFSPVLRREREKERARRMEAIKTKIPPPPFGVLVKTMCMQIICKYPSTIML